MKIFKKYHQEFETLENFPKWKLLIIVWICDQLTK